MIPLRDTYRTNKTPVATACIIALNVLVFLYQVSLDPFSANEFVMNYAVVPARLQPLDLITSMFLHGGWMHLIGNMWFLWIFGDNVEEALGEFKYILLYLASGLAAALTQIIVSAGSTTPILGASGAIAGVMGAYLIKFPHSRIVTLLPIIFFFTTVEIPAPFMLLYWFAIQVFSGLSEIGNTMGNQGGVAFFAHVGGFVAGLILIKTLKTRPDRYFRHPEYRW
jgi:rhomboid family protein